MVEKRSAWTIILCLVFLGGILFPGCTGNSSSRMEELQTFSMDTYFRLTAPGLDDTQKQLILDVLAELDRLFNRFSPDSDISRINANAGEPVPVDEKTLELLDQAWQLAAETEGYFDPTIGSLAELWNIGETQEDWHPPGKDEVAKARELVDYQQLVIHQERGQVQLNHPGMKLDVGGIAKGYAVDRIAKLLNSWQVNNALIDFGGDYYALGEHPEARPWKLGIRHPREPSQAIAILSVEDRAVTTSGDYQRYRLYQGQRFSHLLNPFTGYPSQELASVTVLAPNGVLADGLATAVFIMGPEQGMELVESWPGVDAVIIDQEMNVQVSSGIKDCVSKP